MTKRRSGSHLGFVRAVLKDCANYYPDDQLEFERDYKRLESHYQTYGDRTFLLDLPAIGKVFDLALDRGVLRESGLALTRPINSRTSVPRLFKALWLRVFDRTGCLNEHVDTQAIFLLRTIFFGLKKFRQECSETVLYNTVKEFFDVDEALPPPSPLWSGDGTDCRDFDLGTLVRGAQDGDLRQRELFTDCEQSELHRMLETVQQVADRIAVEFGEFFPSDHRFRHGPGATAESRRGRAFKYAFPNWSPRLQSIFPAEEFAVANLSVLGEDAEADTLFPLREGASRLIAVPKTQKAPRLIAAEPTCNQWAQQCVKSFLDNSIRHSRLGDSIDFRRQELSQQGARLGSISGETATLDLSSASDRLSCWLVQRLFRRNYSLLGAFVACRTRFLTNDIDKKSPKLHKLRKFSSMGSALTFPVQSISFLMLCLGVGSHLTYGNSRDWKSLTRQVRIYGDDIIIPVSWVPWVIEVFTYLGLKVNEQKSFWNGQFRESCGLDAYAGDDVTPAYLLEYPDETKLGSLASVVEVSNNFYKKGLWCTSEWVTRLVPSAIKKLIPVVQIGSGNFGFESVCGFRTDGRIRWNNDLHYHEYQSFLPVGKKKAGPRHEGYANLLQYFTEDPSLTSVTNWESGGFSVTESTLRKGWVQLPEGVAL